MYYIPTRKEHFVLALVVVPAEQFPPLFSGKIALPFRNRVELVGAGLVQSMNDAELPFVEAGRTPPEKPEEPKEPPCGSPKSHHRSANTVEPEARAWRNEEEVGRGCCEPQSNQSYIDDDGAGTFPLVP